MFVLVKKADVQKGMIHLRVLWPWDALCLQRGGTGAFLVSLGDAGET